ncbi:SusE domain-containing protein [Aquimarina sp. RZ0]|uniref:SusE domain-containing protein n=1 Tax=Aquimarina sp. RZ0 TaxID=2607730 RepID=UPI0011F4000D|nr:SusE domain-containing protein [Aquimarina sp. RZ0]KAA1248111.1 SusF/SusE family outer membrane protein [Aquimarina sp. RZ0]
MKKISVLILAFIGILIFNACEENEDPIFVAQEAAEPRIVSPNASVVLSRDTADQPAVTIVWEDANYNVATPITYTIEAATAGSGFSTPFVAGSTPERFFSWTVGELNALAINAGLPTDEEGSLEIRVKSAIGSNNGVEMVSDVTIMTLTPYPAVIPLKSLFLVGNAVDTNKDGVANDSDWDNGATNTYLFRDANDENIFYFQGYFEANEFKLLEIKGQWQPQWGLDGGGFTSSDILGGDPGAFVIPSAGYYALELNIDALTYSLAPIDASAAIVYSTMGLIGSARTGDDSGWDASIIPDTDFMQSPFNPHIWYLEGTEVFDGELKIRADDDWANSWGGNPGLSGQGNNDNDPNIIVTAGTYDIWFNDLDGRFILIPVN